MLWISSQSLFFLLLEWHRIMRRRAVSFLLHSFACWDLCFHSTDGIWHCTMLPCKWMNRRVNRDDQDDMILMWSTVGSTLQTNIEAILSSLASNWSFHSFWSLGCLLEAEGKFYAWRLDSLLASLLLHVMAHSMMVIYRGIIAMIAMIRHGRVLAAILSSLCIAILCFFVIVGASTFVKVNRLYFFFSRTLSLADSFVSLLSRIDCSTFQKSQSTCTES